MSLEVGDSYGGGIIVEIINNRALIVTSSDHPAASWSDATNTIYNYQDYPLFNNDWVLPTVETYKKIRNNLHLNSLGSFSNAHYWTKDRSGQVNRYRFSMHINADNEEVFIPGESSSSAPNQEYIFRGIRYQDIDVEAEFPEAFAVCDAENDELPKTINTDSESINFVVNTNVNIPTLDIEGDLTSNPTVELHPYDIVFPAGWFMFSCPFDTATISQIEYFSDVVDMAAGGEATSVRTLDDESNPINTESIFYYYKDNGVSYKSPTSSSVHLANGFTEEEFETVAIDDFFYDAVADDKIVMAKDGLGSAYLPEWGFNGVGGILKYEGYQVKSTGEFGQSSFGLRVTAAPYFTTVDIGGSMPSVSYSTIIRLHAGWNMICFPLSNASNVTAYFESLVNDDLVTIVKDHNGSAYLPEWNFNGIGDFTPGQGYQVKMADDHSYEIEFADNGPE